MKVRLHLHVAARTGAELRCPVAEVEVLPLRPVLQVRGDAALRSRFQPQIGSAVERIAFGIVAAPLAPPKGVAKVDVGIVRIAAASPQIHARFRVELPHPREWAQGAELFQIDHA